MALRAGGALGALLLAGCAATAGPPLPPASALGGTRTVLQEVRIAAGAEERALQCVLDLGEDGLTLVGLLPFGGRAFTLRYGAAGLQLEAGAPGADAPPAELVLLGIALVHAPAAQWQSALAGSPWSFAEPRQGLRRLLRSGRAVAEARLDGDPWDDRVTVTHFPAGITLEILPAPAVAGP